MSDQRFDFWAGLARFAVASVTVLSACAVFGLMAVSSGRLSLTIPGLMH
ncbi:MAG TPA: hypothetical protein VN154_09590 [Rhizomicrobium sp.]|nr:hypothetical protein [Rhizomicrobium sp.]